MASSTDSIRIGVDLFPEEIEALPPGPLREAAQKEYSEREAEEIKKEWENILETFQKRDWTKTLENVVKYRGKIINEDFDRVTEVAAYLRFFQLRKTGSYHTKDIKVISEALKRVGLFLSGSPWKDKFIELAKEALPDENDLNEGMLTYISQAGIEYNEYKSLIQMAIEKEEKTCLSFKTFKLRKTMQLPIDRKFLFVGDDLLKMGDISNACEIYQELEAGGARAKIVNAFNNKKWRKLRKIAQKELVIDIPPHIDC